MLRVFISYRRGPSTPYARQVYDELSGRLGAERVFYDIDTLEPGTDFLEVIERHIDQSGLMLVVLDPTWSGVSNPDGSPRLHDDEDPVRMEVSRALASDTKVLPVLVGQAKMPKESDLPADLKPLVRRQARELSDTRWRADMEDLVQRSAKSIGVEDVPSAKAAKKSASEGRSRRLLAGGAAALFLAVALGAWMLLGSGGGGGGGDAQGGSTASLQMSAETVGLARQIGSTTGELTTEITEGTGTADSVAAFKDTGKTASDLSQKVDVGLEADDPGKDGLDSGATGFAQASKELGSVAKAPGSAAAVTAAQAARESMDGALAGLEQALLELRFEFSKEGDVDAEAAVNSSVQQLDGNRNELAGIFDGLIEAVNSN